MGELTDFLHWLWSDWGTPNFITRLGIPRIVTSILSCLLAFMGFYYLALRYVPAGDREKVRLLAHDPFILTAYLALYISAITQDFLSFKYKAKGRNLDRILRANWSDPFVKVSMAALALGLFLFLVGSLVYRSHLN